MADHEDYKEMLAAHGIGALDEGEVRSLEIHLRDCAACRDELREWEAIAATLAFDAAPLVPSRQVRDRIIAAVRADVGKSKSPETSPEGSVISGRDSQKVVPLPTQRKASPTIPSWFAVAAGLALVVLLGSLFVLWRQNKAAGEELARLSAQISESQKQLAQQREAIEIVTAQGVRISELSGTKEMPGAHGVVAYDKNGRAILMTKGLPPPPAGKAYQLWFITGGKPMPGKVFITDPSGAGSLTDQMPAEAMNGAVFAITLEPASGVPAPTGAIYLSS